jgi:hypothetical protein
VDEGEVLALLLGELRHGRDRGNMEGASEQERRLP